MKLTVSVLIAVVALLAPNPAHSRKNDRLLFTTGAEERTLEYDANGNTKKLVEAGETKTFGWDFADRLLSVAGPALTGGYKYDADDIRVQAVVNGAATSFLVDHNQPYAQVLEERAGGVVAASYYYGSDLLSQVVGSERSFFHTDALGSTGGLTDAAGGLSERYSFEPFGTMRNFGGKPKTKYLYAGEQYDEAVGGYYLRARYYQPEVGRFFSTDKIEVDLKAVEDINLFTYARNNPVLYTDPSGHTVLAEDGMPKKIVRAARAGVKKVGSCVRKQYREILFYLVAAASGEAELIQKADADLKKKEIVIECVVDRKEGPMGTK